MSPRRAALIADVSAEIGAGHLARCATLARALMASGWQCKLVTRAGAPASLIAGLDVITLNAPELLDAARVGEIVGQADAVVIDNYAITAAFENACRSWAKRIIAIDDASNRAHDCDLLLDQNAGRRAEDYAAVCPPNARVLAGVNFALVGEAFQARRAEALARRRKGAPARNVLLSFGATDPANASPRALTELLAEPWVEKVVVLLSEAAPHRQAIEALVLQAGRRAELILGAAATEIATRVTEADLALGAAGSSAWERCCLGLPSAVVVVAENQREIAAALGASGAALDLGDLASLPAGAFASAARELADAVRREPMIEAAAALCDGEGARRVVQAIEQMCDANRT